MNYSLTPSNGTIVDSTQAIIAQITNGNLDVRRPGKLERPQGIAVKANTIAKTFAEWYHQTGFLSAVISEQDLEERFGFAPPLPKVPAVSKEPFGLIEETIEFEDGPETFYYVFLNGNIVRVGWVRENSVQWAYPEAVLKGRKTISSTRAKEAAEVFRIICGSFSGDFMKSVSTPAKKPTPKKPLVKTAPPKRKLPKASRV